MSSRLRRRPGDEAGTVLLLSLGLFMVALLLIWAVIDASVVFLDRRDLAAAVDGTALAGAQQADLQEIYGQGLSGAVRLDPQASMARMAAFVAVNYPATEFPGWRFAETVSADGRLAEVRGERRIRLPVVGWLTVTATARATLDLG